MPELELFDSTVCVNDHLIQKIAEGAEVLYMWRCTPQSKLAKKLGPIPPPADCRKHFGDTKLYDSQRAPYMDVGSAQALTLNSFLQQRTMVEGTLYKMTFQKNLLSMSTVKGECETPNGTRQKYWTRQLECDVTKGKKQKRKLSSKDEGLTALFQCPPCTEIPEVLIHSGCKCKGAMICPNVECNHVAVGDGKAKYFSKSCAGCNAPLVHRECNAVYHAVGIECSWNDQIILIAWRFGDHSHELQPGRQISPVTRSALHQKVKASDKEMRSRGIINSLIAGAIPLPGVANPNPNSRLPNCLTLTLTLTLRYKW